MLNSLSKSTADIGIDLGTELSRLVTRTESVIVDVPTVIAFSTGDGNRRVTAYGEEARKMLGRTPSGTLVVRPVTEGVITDFSASEALIRALLKEQSSSIRGPRVLMCIPNNTTEVERRAIQDAARAAGAREVFLAPQVIAAALGADLPIQAPCGSMIVDIGAGRTDVAVISLGGIVVSRSIRAAGQSMDEAISAWLRRRHNLVVSERTLTTVKLGIGCAGTPAKRLQMRVRGRDIGKGNPMEIDLTSQDISEALEDVVRQIQEVVVGALQATPPELASDIIDRGIILCGGACILPGLDAVLREATGLPVLHVDKPMQCTARGAAQLLREHPLFERIAFKA
jgi:rod shape-determining protein MreB and related proteins